MLGEHDQIVMLIPPKIPSLAGLTTSLILSTVIAHSAVIVEDSFDGVAVNNGGSGWFGFSNWNNNEFGANLTFGSLATSGQASTLSDPFGQTGREYPTISSGTIWISWIQNVGSVVGERAFVSFSNEGSMRFQIGQKNDSPDSSFRLYGSDQTPVKNTGISNNGTHFLAVSLNLDNGDLALYVDPTGLGSGSSPSIAATVTHNFGATSIGQFTFERRFNTFTFDELRIGTTWADVSPIPEPSTYAALIGSVSLGLVIARRRR